MAGAGIGTDTGGSCRIPAALSGIVGFKPTASRVPRAGVTPLSTTLDSVGPVAPTVSCCALLDAVMSAGELRVPDAFPLRGLRLLLPDNYVLETLDDAVAAAFDRSLAALSQAGALITRAPVPELERLPEINAKGGFSGAESYALYGALIEAHGSAFDPRVAARILKGREQSAADYLALQRSRAELIRAVRAATAPHDAVLMPTAPIIAPPLGSLGTDAEYFRANALVLRNPSIANFLDGCAISIPIHRSGEAPVGLMLMAETGADRRLLAIARAAESLLSPAPEPGDPA
jgi:aspartyl-tRNA(Asn)/glutamyl-tRNA(Gln) amidotransferase subunit A